jgi:hypothetical protein
MTRENHRFDAAIAWVGSLAFAAAGTLTLLVLCLVLFKLTVAPLWPFSAIPPLRRLSDPVPEPGEVLTHLVLLLIATGPTPSCSFVPPITMPRYISRGAGVPPA